MRIIYFLLSIVSCFQIKPIIKPNIKLYGESNNLNNFKINNKINDYLSLIRYKNILPTTLLNLSGGLIMHPSINLFFNQQFLISIINTLLIMSSSMVLNDLYDIDVDKINNSNRPLVTGKISINEAKLFVFTLLGLTQFLSILFLNKNLNFIIQLSILNIIIYTPILKKITFIKNISCAFLISFSPIFSGLAANINNNKNNNNKILYILSGIIFLGSLSCEILYDIRDKDGDEKNNIITIPVKYGNEISLNIIRSITIFNIFFIVTSILYNFKYFIVLPILVFLKYY
jgi:geranylgeranylglycerol-phosphate geranylgeranyltransferase